MPNLTNYQGKKSKQDEYSLSDPLAKDLKPDGVRCWECFRELGPLKISWCSIK